jgi:hypothetical protein
LHTTTGELKKKISIYDESHDTGALITEESTKPRKPDVHVSLLGPSQVNPLAKAGVVGAEQGGKKAATQQQTKKEDKTAANAATAKSTETLTLQEQLDKMQLTAAADDEEEEAEEKVDDEKVEEADEGNYRFPYLFIYLLIFI